MEATIDDFWQWFETLPSFTFEGQRYTPKVERYEAVYPYPHRVVRHTARAVGQDWILDLDGSDPDSPTLMHLYKRFEREWSKS